MKKKTNNFFLIKKTQSKKNFFFSSLIIRDPHFLLTTDDMCRNFPTTDYITLFIISRGCSDSGCNTRATLDKHSCVIASTLFKMNSTCMRLCDLNFSCLSTSITSPEVSSCKNNKCIQIQYGRPCLHFVYSNFNIVNLRQWLGFP